MCHGGWGGQSLLRLPGFLSTAKGKEKQQCFIKFLISLVAGGAETDSATLKMPFDVDGGAWPPLTPAAACFSNCLLDQSSGVAFSCRAECSSTPPPSPPPPPPLPHGRRQNEDEYLSVSLSSSVVGVFSSGPCRPAGEITWK